MSSIKVHATRQFDASFRSLLAEGPSSLIMVSPYLTPIRGWDSVLQFTRFVMSRGTEKLEIVTCPPLANNHTLDAPNLITHGEAELIEAAGVSLKIRDTKLHAKLFYFEFEDPRRYAAFIGSSNFTAGGFERNDEIMVRIEHPDDRIEVRRQVDRLSMYGSFPYNVWKTRRVTGKGLK